MTLKLHSVNIGGNLHVASGVINKWGWAEYLIHLESVSGYNTIAIFRMPAEKVHQIRTDDRSYVADPHHDDYRGPTDQFSMFSNATTPTGWDAVDGGAKPDWSDFAAGADAGNTAGSEVRSTEGLPKHLTEAPDDIKEIVERALSDTAGNGEPGAAPSTEPTGVTTPSVADPGETIMPPLPEVVTITKPVKAKAAPKKEQPVEKEQPANGPGPQTVDTSNLPEWAR